MVIPAGTYPDQLFQANKKKYDPKRLEQQRAKAAEEFFTRDVKTPEAPPGKQNIDIQTDQFVSELTDKAPVYEIGCQTEYKIHRPPTPHKMPKLMGVSKKTLVEDNELFLYEEEVEPILSVLCGKTLEVARMEVLQEEEIAEMKRQQTNFVNIQEAEDEEIKKMEELEEKKLAAYEAKKSLEKSRREAKKVAHQKVASRALAKQFNRDLKVNTFILLKDVGYFSDRFKEQVMEGEVMPWLLDQTETFVKNMDSYNSYPNTLIAGYIEESSKNHVEKVKAHEKKLADAKKAADEAAAAKKAEREAKRAEKERLRREAERKELEGTIEKMFIETAKPIDNVLQ